MIPLFKPELPSESIELANKVMKSHWLGEGEYVKKFEKLFCEKFDYKYALAVNSCTSALWLALKLSNVKKRDEVIVPVLTCAATIAPIIQIGAKPIFCDIDDDLNINQLLIEQLLTHKTKAIICVDFGGLPCDYDKLMEICKFYDLKLIADAAHSLGASYDMRYAGWYPDFACYSFQAVKHITTGDGGMLVCKRKEDYERAKKLRWFGIDRENRNPGRLWEYDIKEAGFKFHMNDITAAIGIPQLKNIEENIKRRGEIAYYYKQSFSLDSQKISVIQDKYSNSRHSYWLYMLWAEDRDKFIRYMAENGIMTSPVHIRCDKYSAYPNAHCPNMDKIEPHYVAIPIRHNLTDGEVEKIVNTVKRF